MSSKKMRFAEIIRQVKLYDAKSYPRLWILLSIRIAPQDTGKLRRLNVIQHFGPSLPPVKGIDILVRI